MIKVGKQRVIMFANTEEEVVINKSEEDLMRARMTKLLLSW